MINDPKRVLCVEDDPTNAFVIKAILKGHYQVEVVQQAQEALPKILANDYQALLIDINLGKGQMTGLELLAKIKQSNRSNVPAFALTAYALPGDEEKFLQAGFDHYISKPINRDILLKLLDAACSPKA
ncbi:MAG: response regulator [Bacteroidia bacterium]|nr:response regulator [Bacteroidia bacterium]